MLSAVHRHVPLVFPAGRYKVLHTVDIDYADAADVGLEVQGNGAIIDGTAIPFEGDTMIMWVHCSGGTPQAPKACFYFHLAGTLHVYANRPHGWAVWFGNLDLSDAHNSMKVDHLDVNNAAYDAGGTFLGYVFNADLDIISNGGDRNFAFWIQQLQFSVLKGAAGTPSGWGIFWGTEGGYNISNTIEGFGFEPGAWCSVNTNSKTQHNTFVSPYFNCAHAVFSIPGETDVLVNPLFAGDVQDKGRLDGFQILP